jgi:hypothetical protein
MSYQGFDVVMIAPDELTVEQCEAGLRASMEAHPEMVFKGKNWETPKAMLQ